MDEIKREVEDINVKIKLDVPPEGRQDEEIPNDWTESDGKGKMERRREEILDKYRPREWE